MSSIKTSRIALAGLLVAVVILGSCAGEAPARVDLGYTPPPPAVDYGVPSLDTGYKQDQYVWPDSYQAPPPDTWPAPADSYSSTPFGCSIDEDCFGRVCCETPWGVKLCADSC